MVKLYDEPVQGLEILDPVQPPGVNDTLLGYEIIIFDDNAGCFVKPRPMHMNVNSWMLVGLLAIIFWPIMCLPCCLKPSYNTYQRPVYGKSE